MRGSAGLPSQDIQVLIDPSLAGLQTELRWLNDATARPSQRLLYYSGHAAWLSGSEEPALLAEDSDPEDPFSCLTTQQLHGLVGSCPRAEHTWILDCCFSGGVGFGRLPDALEGALSHHVLAAGDSYDFAPSGDGPDQRHSPFTTALLLAFGGLAYRSASTSELTLPELHDFLVAEAARLDLPEPTLRSAGRPTSLRFRRVIQPPPDLRPRRSRRHRAGERLGWGRVEPGRMLVVSGSAGSGRAATLDWVARTTAARASRGSWRDGRQILAMGLVGDADTDTQPALIAEARDPRVWTHAAALVEHRPVLTSSSLEPDVIARLAPDAIVFQTPPLGPEDVMDAASRLKSSNRVALVDPVLELAQSSFEELERVMARLAVLERAGVKPHEVLASTEELLGLTGWHRPSDPVGTAAVTVIAVCACSPGVQLPLPDLLTWAALRSRSASSILEPPRMARIISDMGVAAASSQWVSVPERFADEIAAYSGQGWELLIELLSWARHKPMPVVARLQLLRAAAIALDRLLDDHGPREAIGPLFELCGLDFVAATGRPYWMPPV